MAQYIDKYALVAEIDRLGEVQPLDEFQPKEQNKIDWLAGKLFTITNLKLFLDTLEVKEVQEEPVSEDLEDAVNEYIGHKPDVDESLSVYCKRQAFKAGAKWQKGQFEKEREILDESKTTNKRKRTMKFKINNDYKCVMITPSVNYWYNDKRSLFIGWLCWGFNIEF